MDTRSNSVAREVTAGKGAARTCVSCRQTREPAALLRVVRGPDNTPVPDWNRKLGGRGAHVCLSRRCIGAAMDRRLFDKAFRAQLNYPSREVFMALVDAHLQRGLSALLSSAASRKWLLVGTDAVIEGFRQHSVRLVIATPDSALAGEFAERAAQGGVRFHSRPRGTQRDLGDLLGRRPTGVVGIVDERLAAAVDRLFMIWNDLEMMR